MAPKETTLTTLLAIGPDGGGIPPFRIGPRYRWEHFDSTDPDEQAIYGPTQDSPGFMAKIRVPTWGETIEMERALAESDDAFWRCVRPRIVAWNALMEDVNGVVQPVPAPADHEDNWQAPFVLERPLVVWLFAAVRYAHFTTAQRERLAQNRAEMRAKRLASPDPEPPSDSATPDESAA